MLKIIRNLLCILLIFALSTPVALAKQKQKNRAAIQTDFVLKDATDEVVLITYEPLKINDELTIPKGGVIYASNFQAQRALRWHKSGFIICRITKYSKDEFSDETIDLSDKELYLVARKYEKVYKKDAAILTTEILLTQGASIFAPGVDIFYFFTKGAIQRDKHPNWFKAGVSNAYENSICWFWLKGKKINLAQGDDIDLKVIEKEKAYKLKAKMVKRKTREDLKALKKELKKEFKIVKNTEKREIKQLKKELKEEKKFAKNNPPKSDGEIVTDEKEITVKNVHAAVKIEETNEINQLPVSNEKSKKNKK